jgi:predicted CopG family antitoxin
MIITHVCVFKYMGHRTLTVSDEAYNALYKMKKERESFTETILRLTKQTEKGTLLDYIRTLEPDDEFANTLETVLEDRNNITSRPLED